MSSIEVRPFHRGDREQLTHLVNAHVQAVVPGVSLSVNTVLSHLEREPGEFVEDPWIDERVTLVAFQRQRLVAAAHLQRYASDSRVSADYRNAGVVRWLVCRPPSWPWADAGYDGLDAGRRMPRAAGPVAGAGALRGRLAARTGLPRRTRAVAACTRSLRGRGLPA